MLIISGSSPKQQILGQRNEPCAACRQGTPHTLLRHYRVKHLFWFPLFSTGTTYAKICERCRLHTAVAAPPPGTVPAAPGLHRIGFLVPLGVVLLPILLVPIALVIGALGGHGVASGAGAQAADTPPISDAIFGADTADRAAQTAIQQTFDDLGLRGAAVAARSAAAGGHTVRLVTAQYSRLKKVSDGDRVRLLQNMEQIADTSFPDDEVFAGLQGRIFWGGHSHRKGGETWSRLVDESTPNPETDARAALRALELAAPAAPTGDASAARGVQQGHPMNGK